VVCLLAVASYLTTCIIWDGGFPAGEFRISVVNDEGKPIPGAVLRVFQLGPRRSAGNYPLVEHSEANGIVAGPDGVILCHQMREGLQFGGTAWYLFWFIPMGEHSGPSYELEFTGDGYDKATLSDEWLFYEDRYAAPVQPVVHVVFDRFEANMPTWSKRVTLHKRPGS
jgi:hypothetical protein